MTKADALFANLRSLYRKERGFLMFNLYRQNAGDGLEKIDIQGAEMWDRPFFKEIGKALQGGEPRGRDFFVAMDYHLDWLAGAAMFASKGIEISKESKGAKNGQIELPEFIAKFKKKGTGEEKENCLNLLFHGGQEDADLLIAWVEGDTCRIVIVEAKTDSHWSSAKDRHQLTRKLIRLAALLRHLKVPADGQEGAWLELSMFLTSATDPGPSNKKTVDWIEAGISAFIDKEEPVSKWRDPEGGLLYESLREELNSLNPRWVRLLGFSEDGALTRFELERTHRNSEPSKGRPYSHLRFKSSRK